MPALTPCPIPADFPLVDAVARAPRGSSLGVWLPLRRPVTVAAISAGQRRVLLIDGDLGRLLRRCASILVRIGTDATVVSAEALIRIRALRIVSGLPYVPTLPDLPASPARDALRALFSDARAVSSGVQVPLAERSAEEVLSACAAARVPVLFSQIIYNRIGPEPGRGPGGGLGA